jgi:DNA-binding response OmpR family regulator
LKRKILLVEDSKEIFPMVKQSIGAVADLEWVKTIEEAKQKLEEFSFNLIILDINLPDGSGIDLCAQIRASSPSTPIFMLSSNTQLSEKVMGFSAGADDYITKPFETLELKARIEATFRKQESLNESLNNLKWKELEILRNRQEVKVLENDEYISIDLTSLEYKILTYFAEKPEHVFARDKILNDIWGQNVYVYPRSVDTHVSKLRKKLRNASEVIESVHGVGYKFCPTKVI